MSDAELRRLIKGVLLPGFLGSGPPPDWVRAWLDAGLGGVVLFGRNIVDDEQVASLTEALRDEREDVVIGIDEEGGDVTRLDAGTGSTVPGSLALGAAADVELTRAVAESMGRRLADCGVTVDFAPSADLLSPAGDPVIGVRSFGSDPAAAAAQVTAFVEGLQAAGVAACLKHFPGHGAAESDSHHALPVLPRTEQEMYARDLVPFQAGIRAGARAVMTGHLVVTDWGPEPATLNPRVLGGVLRTELGFDGPIITDALEMAAISGHSPDAIALDSLVPEGIGRGAVLALAAGADGLCLGGELADESVALAAQEAVVASVKAGILTEERIAESVTRLATIGLAAPRGGSRSGARIADDVGLIAARRALRVSGDLRLACPPLVVDLAVAPTIAVGDVPWGLGPVLRETQGAASDVRVLRLVESDPERVIAAAAGGPVVVTTRDAAHHPWVRELIGRLVDAGVELVHVETGAPGPSLGEFPRIDSHGGSLVCLRAVAELLVDAQASPKGSS
ncbi:MULTISPECIES: glycoside hydrolase family 3 N-terminal domain-containing protein [Actinoalloteichus]|uniref:Beta-glucosidase-like glycosyl hydrolase n=1 Tax=Actinoalloteichus fjordicus TaxID=1612552 RepID=A0AAC9PPX9_9PSEU|nr:MULTISPECIES: glycoside hydrolase family 3 N-terminal domain-containing protein [Actinoalloteichus]APU12485.1 beta-glucosidase-like glycosyl hydrolase [Actinoalloteichus fjordicus]APU18438.1 beta-glucosidase-like glycosyl hydrolase [Actinoalloteichus sp. GBA129-24]